MAQALPVVQRMAGLGEREEELEAVVLVVQLLLVAVGSVDLEELEEWAQACFLVAVVVVALQQVLEEVTVAELLVHMTMMMQMILATLRA